MSDWLSAQALIDLRLPGSPGSDKGIHAWARRQGWESRVVTGRGGKRIEYRVPDALLGEVEKPDAAAEFAALAAQTWRDELQARFFRHSAKKQKRALGYARALRIWRGLDAAPNGFAQLPERTLWRKWAIVAEHSTRDWAALLIDDRAGRPRERGYSSRVDDLFRAAYLRPERPSSTASYDLVKQCAQDEKLPLPSLRTLMRRMRREMGWQEIRAARYGAKALEATFPAQERDRSCFRALEALSADGWRADNLVEWADGEIARPILVSWQDLYSGAILGWRVDKTENLDLIRLSFGDVLRVYGIPAAVYIDNGHAFAGRWLSGRTPHRFRFKVHDEEPAGLFLCSISRCIGRCRIMVSLSRSSARIANTRIESRVIRGWQDRGPAQTRWIGRKRGRRNPLRWQSF